MPASTSAFSTKLSAPLRHLLVRNSAVSLVGKLAADRTPAVFTAIQKPILDGGVDGVDKVMLFGRVDSPATRTLSRQVMKSEEEDDDDNLPMDESDFDENESDTCFDTDDEDFIDDDVDDSDDKKS